jgi:hypothetical protein
MAETAKAFTSGSSLVLTLVVCDAAPLFERLDEIGGDFPARAKQGRARRRKAF